MDPMEIVAGLARFEHRAPGTDAERRAALWLRRRLAAAGRDAELEPEWVRPHWAWLHALHAAVGVSASLVALTQPIAGLAILTLAAISAMLDLLGVAHLLRRVTPERATQNVVSPPTPATASGAQRIVRLVIVGHYDAPHGGLMRRRAITRLGAVAQRRARGYLPGPLAAIPLALLWLAGVASARLGGVEARWLDLLQLAPTLLLLVSLALLLDMGLSGVGPGAGDPASGAAVAVALAAALDRSPPRHLAVELVLAGAGDGPSLGLRAFVRRRRRRYVPESTAVLHLSACGRGRPVWWTVDGALAPRRLHPRLGALCAQIARERPALGARPHRGHGSGAGWRARLAGWPAITIGCLDTDGLVPDAGRPTDTVDRLDPQAMRDALALSRVLVERLDADLGRRLARRDPAPARP